MTNEERYEARVRIYGNTCHYCKRELTIATYTIDHVHPLAKGGLDIRENKVACCYRCNRNKGKIHPNAWVTHPMHPKNVKRRRERNQKARARRLRKKWVY